jgi:hypothetical protein
LLWVSGGGQAAVVYIYGSCHRGVIVQNTINAPGNAVQTKGMSDNILILQNTFSNSQDASLNLGGATGQPYFRPPISTTTPNYEAANISVIGNLILNSAESCFAFLGCVNCVAVQNTCVNPAQRVFRILQETTSGTYPGYTFLAAQNGTIMNNILHLFQ